MGKKILCCLVLFLALGYNLVAADDDDKQKERSNFSLGAGFTWANNPKLLGGYFDFGMVLYRNVLYVQNSFVLRGANISLDGEDHTIFTLSEKLVFGRNSEYPLRIYTYIEGGIGIFGNQNRSFGEAPAYTLGFGGGGELSSENFGGLFFEIGYIGQKTDMNYPVSGIIIQSGWKIFF